jgi:hypothetical protein
MSLLATTLVPALIPALSDGVRGLISKFTGGAGAKPQNVDEAIKLMTIEMERMKILAELDKPSGMASKWVYDLRESARYIAVYLCVLNWIGQSYIGTDAVVMDMSANLAQAAVFFLFGDRVYLHLKKRA